MRRREVIAIRIRPVDHAASELQVVSSDGRSVSERRQQALHPTVRHAAERLVQFYGLQEVSNGSWVAGTGVPDGSALMDPSGSRMRSPSG